MIRQHNLLKLVGAAIKTGRQGQGVKRHKIMSEKLKSIMMCVFFVERYFFFSFHLTRESNFGVRGLLPALVLYLEDYQVGMQAKSTWENSNLALFLPFFLWLQLESSCTNGQKQQQLHVLCPGFSHFTIPIHIEAYIRKPDIFLFPSSIHLSGSHSIFTSRTPPSPLSLPLSLFICFS